MTKKRVNIKKIAAEFILQFVTICIIQGLLFTSLVTTVFTEKKVERNTASILIPQAPQSSKFDGSLGRAQSLGSFERITDFSKKAHSLLLEKKSDQNNK